MLSHAAAVAPLQVEGLQAAEATDPVTLYLTVGGRMGVLLLLLLDLDWAACMCYGVCTRQAAWRCAPGPVRACMWPLQ